MYTKSFDQDCQFVLATNQSNKYDSSTLHQTTLRNSSASVTPPNSTSFTNQRPNHTRIQHERSSTNFYNNLTNNHHVNSYLNSLDHQQYSLFNQYDPHRTSSSSSLSSTSSSSNSQKLIVHDNEIRLSSNLATFVSESQLAGPTSNSTPFQDSYHQFEAAKLFSLFKSSLLEILAGRRVKGTSGKINIDLQHFNLYRGIERTQVKSEEQNWNKIASSIAFIPQKDYHLGWLTVYETLIYASKIKNCKLAKKLIYRQRKLKENFELYLKQQVKQNTKLGHLSKEQFNNHIMNQLSQAQMNQLQFSSNVASEEEYHQTIVINILKDLSLENCMHNLVRNCSGGQKRRLSIGLELLNQPRLILIDEPTTGLDFSSALKCIQTLRSLTMMNKPPGIIASIHQPSSLVLNQFHRVYALAKGGRCIYEGPVDNLVDYFSSFHVNCPLYFNPADFAIQIANSDFGQQLITKLADHQTKLHETISQEMSTKIQFNNQTTHHQQSINHYQVSHLKVNVKHLMKRLNQQTHPTLSHTKLLLDRSWKCTIREPTLTWLRLFQFVFTALLIANLHNYKVGEIDGCFSDLTLNSSHLNKATLIANGEDYVQQLAKIKDNSILLFFSLMFWVMSSIIPTLLTFPNEMMVFIKERSNGWYSCASYYMAKMLCDLPFVIVCPFLFCIVFYPLTGQLMIWWRFMLFYFIALLLCLIAQSLGFIVGSIFINDKFSAIFIGSVQSFPVFMAGGYLIRESVMNWMIKPLWHMSYIRYSFSAIILSVYGFGRCSKTSNNKSTIQTVLSNITQTDKTLLSQMREVVNEEDFNCLYDSYYTDSGYNLDNYFRNCNLTLANLFSRTINTGDLNKQLEHETELFDNSFVLSYYEVTNDLFSWNILCLIITLVVLRGINYLIILHNVKKHSKY